LVNPRNFEQQDTREDKTCFQDLMGNTWGQIAVFVGGVLLYLLFGVVLWWVFNQYVDPGAIQDRAKRAAAKTDLFQALGFIMVGVAGAIGIFFTWRGQRLAQEGLEDTRRSTQENLRLAREGQIAERFTRAIDQLGKMENEKKVLEVRLGAIYALERIASESDELYWPSLEILAAYVRHNAAKKSEEEEHEYWVGHADADIQAIIHVFGQRTREYGKGEDDRILLEATDLRNTNFRFGNFTGIWFWKADLRGANFGFSDLRGAAFAESDLRKAFFDDVENLAEVNFRNADLEGTRFYGANLAAALNLTQNQIEQAKGDEDTILPEGLTRPARWTADSSEANGT
jgi:hypothetical protein